MQPGAGDQGQQRPVGRAVAAPASSTKHRKIVQVQGCGLVLVADPAA